MQSGSRFIRRAPCSPPPAQDGQVRIWTLDGKRLAEATLPRAGNAVAFSSDGQRLAVATDDRVVVFAVK
jgi:WD40 repeat protein